MGVDVMCWRARIGTYCHRRLGGTLCRGHGSRGKRSSPNTEFSQDQRRSTPTVDETGSWEFSTSLALRLCVLLLLVTSMSVETNPGPRGTSQETGMDTALVETGMVCVKDSFRAGVGKITDLVEYIKRLQPPTSFTEVQKVRKNVECFVTQAYENIKDASDKSLLLNNALSRQIEGLPCRQGEKERQVEEHEREINKLRSKIDENQKHLKVLQYEYRNAEKSHREAEECLTTAKGELEAKRRDQNIVRGFGFGLLLFPLLGLTLIAVSETALESNVNAAKDVRNTASENVTRQHEGVCNKRKDIVELQGKLKRIEDNKNRTSATIQEQKQNIDELRRLYAEQSKVGEKLRKCASIIAIAADRSEFLHDQVKHLYNPQAVILPLKELTEVLGSSEMSQSCLEYANEDLDLFATNLKMIADEDSRRNRENVLGFRKAETSMTDVATVEQASNLYADSALQEDRRLMMAKYAGWEHFLVPAPMTIAFLGQLMLISTHQDFPMDKNAPKDGFKLLRNPKSFRASVLQVSNKGWNAFNTANRSMDQIRIYMKTLPLHLKDAFDILTLASHKEVQQFLPQKMASVKNVAEKCLQRATVTQDDFMCVMEIIAELQEACVATKGDYETKQQHTKISRDVFMEEKKVIEEQREQLKQRKAELQESIQKAEEDFSETVTSLPSGAEVLGMAVTEGIMTGVSTALDGASIVVGAASTSFVTTKDRLKNSFQKVKKKFRTTDDQKLDRPTKKTGDSDKEQELDKPSRKAYEVVDSLQKIVNNLSSTFVKVDTLNKGNVGRDSTTMIYYEKQVEQVLNRLIKIDDCQVKGKVKQLCDRAVSICTQLSSISRNIAKTNKAEAKAIASDILKLQEDTLQLSLEGHSLMGSCPRQRSPMLQSAHARVSEWQVTQSMNNAKWKADESCRLLQIAQKNYANESERITDVSNRLSDILGEMAKLDMEKLNFEQILDTLNRGLVAISNMKTQWGKIVHFFQTITNIIDASVNTSLTKFLDISENAGKSSLAGYNLTHLKRDMLYQEIIHVSELTGFVTLVAESYKEMSAEHIMPKLKGLQKLLCFHPQNDKDAIKQKQCTLQTECTDAQKKITDLIEKKKGKYLCRVDTRIAAIFNRK